MKILLLGKNGQLGHELHTQAEELRLTIEAYSREELDITDETKIAEVIKKNNPDTVINASAYHVVPQCETFPDQAFAINTIAVQRLAKLCKDRNIRFIHYSTDYVFDGKKGSPYEEADSPNPVQMYGISKYAGELACNAYYPEGSIIIRTSAVYGGKTGSHAKKGNFILSILRDAQGKASLEVSSEQIVSPTYAVDLAKASLQLLKQNPHAGVYHLVNEGYCSWAELAAEIVKIKKIRTKIIPVDRSGFSGGSPRPLFTALKNVKANSLGIILPSWKDAVKRYLTTF